MLKFLLAISLLFLPAQAWASKRVALIIGNNGYVEVDPLQKAVADAEAIAQKMSAAGFQTVVRTDADRRATNLAISDFTSLLEPGDTAFVFYAGHGVQIDGENYLLPTDIAAPQGVSEEFIKAESIALSNLLDRIRQTGARTTLAIIDACRDNPFEARNGRSIGGTRGLARIAAPEGTFVMFSAGAGQQALDRLSDSDPDANSVFTRTLLSKLDRPGLELRDMIFQVRSEVRDLARNQGHEQFPAYYDELLGDFYLRPTTRTVTSQAPAPETPQPGNIRADFDLARSIGTAEAYNRFISQYESHPDQFVVGVARDLMAAVGPATQQPARPSPPTPAQTTDPRATMRATQTALNRIGCNAGGADGIAGSRTRSAFSAFLRNSGANLTASDLGSEKALTILQDQQGTICKTAAPATTRTATASPKAPPSTGPSLVGAWRFQAKCPLFIRTTGTASMRSTGGNGFSGSMRDSIGQHGQITGQMDGRSFSLTVRTPSAQATEFGTISADGQSYQSQNSFGCKISATRVQ